ncbi:MAG: preprotein translocase subunit YajC [Sarcina sp.]
MSLEGMLITFGPIVIMFIVFWVLMIMPEKRRQKKYAGMLSELRIHDKIVTKGGIIGRIHKINGDEIIIESEGTKLRVAKQGINSKLEKGSEKPEIQ